MRAVTHNIGGMSLKDLSSEVDLSHSTVSGIIDRLEQKQMVVRRTDADDARRSVITVSAFSGHAMQKPDTIPCA